MILDQVSAFLEQSPANNSELLARVLSAVLQAAGERDSQFRAKVQDEIRVGLLGSHPYHHRPEGWKSDLEQVTAEDIAQFFTDNCGTDRAFVLATGPFPSELRERVSVYGSRHSS
jgi:predicted Zn-dependent peptidase